MPRSSRNFKTEKEVAMLLTIKEFIETYDCRPIFQSDVEEMEVLIAIRSLLAINPWTDSDFNDYLGIRETHIQLLKLKRKRRKENLTCDLKEKKWCNIL